MLRSRELEFEYMARSMSPDSNRELVAGLYSIVFTVQNMDKNSSLLGVGGNTLIVACNTNPVRYCWWDLGPDCSPDCRVEVSQTDSEIEKVVLEPRERGDTVTRPPGWVESSWLLCLQ